MKFAWLALLLATFCGNLGAVVLQLSGDEDPTCTAGFICIQNGSFSFNVNSQGGGFFQILNNDPTTYTTLNFDIPYQNSDCPNNVDQVTLMIDQSFINEFGSSSFSSSASSVCRINTSTFTTIADYYLSLTFGPGIGPDAVFDLNLNDNTSSMDPSGAGGWLLSATTTNSAGNAPEPATLAIAGSGLLMVALVSKRRYLTSLRNSGSRASDFKSASPAASFRE